MIFVLIFILIVRILFSTTLGPAEQYGQLFERIEHLMHYGHRDLDYYDGQDKEIDYRDKHFKQYCYR